MTNPSDTYKVFAHYYDLYVGNFSADLDFYLSLCSKKDQILEVGCGTGRVMLKFLLNNFQISGIDISEEMLDIARLKLDPYKQQEKFKLAIHDLSEKCMSEKYDKALITFYTFNYIIAKPEIFLKNLYDSINKKGVAVFDLFCPKSLINDTINDIWTESAIQVNNKNIILKDNRRFDHNIEYRSQIYIEDGKELQIDTERRYYSPQEMKFLLKQSGFKNTVFSTMFDKNTFSNRLDEKVLKTNYVVKAVK